MTRHHPAIAMLAAILLLGSIWIASQRSLWPVEPGKFAAIVYLASQVFPFLGLQWVCCAGLGWLPRRLLVPDAALGAVIQTGVGLALFLGLNWGLALAGLLNRVTAWGVLGLGAALLVLQLIATAREAPRKLQDLPLPPWTFLLGVPAVGLLITACCCPPGTLWAVEAFGYDVMSYHLQLPREWLEAGRMHGLEHNVYSFLPNLVEATYMQIGALSGSMYDGIYWAQFFHASMGVFAAIAIGSLTAVFTGPVAGGVAGSVMLCVPWTLIAGSLAYDEMAVLALGATALLVAFDPMSERWRGAAVVGLLCGSATMAKLTAGPLVALPVGLLMMSRLNHALRWRLPPSFRACGRSALIAALFGALALSPYLVRNQLWCQNPVFPFAPEQFGHGHWSKQLSDRWSEGHGLDAAPLQGLAALGRQWMFNAGYGAIGGHKRAKGLSYDIARFHREGGVPVLWVAVLVSMALSLTGRAGRNAASGLLLVMLVQLSFWLAATHLQSRFLIPTLLPACVLVGLGAGRLQQFTPRRQWIMPLGALTFAAVLWSHSLTVFFQQTPTYVDVESGQRMFLRPWQIIDGIPIPRPPEPPLRIIAAPNSFSDHPINHLGPSSRTFLVADASRLLYIRNPILYHSAFDADPLGEMIRTVGDDARDITDWLGHKGITHVWVNWSELERLHRTYGYDRDVTARRLTRIAEEARWVAIDGYPQRGGDRYRHATLFRLP